MSAPPADRTPTDAELMDVVVCSLDQALERIDADPEMGPGDQLATLAVGLVRGLAPVLRVERDRMLAEDAEQGR